MLRLRKKLICNISSKSSESWLLLGRQGQTRVVRVSQGSHLCLHQSRSSSSSTSTSSDEEVLEAEPQEEFEGVSAFQTGKINYGDPNDINTGGGVEGVHPSQRYWKFAYKYWWLFGPTKVKRYVDSMEETGIRPPPDAGSDWTQPPSHWEPGMPVRPFMFDEIPPLNGPRSWQIWESASYFLLVLPCIIALTFGVRHVRQGQGKRDGLFYCINDHLVEQHLADGKIEESQKEDYRKYLDARTKDMFDNRNIDFTYPRTRVPVCDSPLMYKFKGLIGMQQNHHLHQEISQLSDSDYQWLYETYLEEDDEIDPIEAVREMTHSKYVPEQVLLAGS